MPKKKGGKKKKKGKKSGGSTEKRALILATDMEEYAKIMKMLGDRRMTVVLPDSSEVLALIPGRFRRRVWMKPGDVVLVSRREFQNQNQNPEANKGNSHQLKVDVVYKYHADEVRKLHKKDHIPEFFLDMMATKDVEDESGIIIGTEENSEDEFKFDEI